jgi:hypothetical protein
MSAQKKINGDEIKSIEQTILNNPSFHDLSATEINEEIVSSLY